MMQHGRSGHTYGKVKNKKIKIRTQVYNPTLAIGTRSRTRTHTDTELKLGVASTKILHC